MPEIQVEKCPETGICSIIKEDGQKVDLISPEVTQLQDAAGDEAKVKEVLSAISGNFATSLTAEEVKALAAKIK